MPLNPNVEGSLTTAKEFKLRILSRFGLLRRRSRRLAPEADNSLDPDETAPRPRATAALGSRPPPIPSSSLSTAASVADIFAIADAELIFFITKNLLLLLSKIIVVNNECVNFLILIPFKLDNKWKISLERI